MKAALKFCSTPLLYVASLNFRYKEIQLSRSAAYFNEVLVMSNSSSLLNIQDPAHPANRLMSLVKFGVLIVSVAAAIPTARNLYFSWKNDVPFDQVDHRLAQAELLEKNFDCKINYRTLQVASDARVEVGSCGKTNDISIRLTGKDGQTNYEWIAFDRLPKPATTKTAGLFDAIIAKAYADDAHDASKFATDDSKPIVVAQDSSVLCQSKVGDNVVRVVQSGNQCVRETVSIFKGSVEKSESVPCASACPIR
jgi:hypothetical protein